MKITITEHSSHIEISLDPETQEEQLQLLRLSRNAKQDGVTVRTFLFPKQMQTDILFNLYKDSANCISNEERKKR